jgi:fibronectin type 3 domain-containing protein
VKFQFLYALLLLAAAPVVGQDSLRVQDAIGVIARPSPDSITLRWAPKTVQTWMAGNQNGYLIERYVIVRNGALVSPPLKSELTPQPLRPYPESAWEPLVRQTKYAAIAAQALFGDRFEVDLGNSDVISMVNKLHETEQRFSFALFCADMSPATARASGLWFTDRSVKKGEKYLYRIRIAGTDKPGGSVFIGTDDRYGLPPPAGLEADFANGQVSLRWEQSILTPYTAYQLERSANGRDFQPVNREPLVQVTPDGAEESRYAYASDSLPDPKITYFYRVRGLTPFGEPGEPSEAVSGKSTPLTYEVPFISSGENRQNTSILLQWQYPTEAQPAIEGFRVERAPTARGEFLPLTPTLLKPDTRSFEDTRPNQVNYYRVTAHTLRGTVLTSPVFFAALVDSIPPAMPQGLQARVDEEGVVALRWRANREPDIYGYRVYRCNFSGEELSQVTSEPVPDSTFSDMVALNTLNEAIYYGVIAVDRSQNESPVAVLKVPLPDKVKPQPPVLLPLQSSENGITISWWPSASEDVVQYDVYRLQQKDEWMRVKIVKATTDTLYRFVDTRAEPGNQYVYLVVAVDDAGWESDPTTPVKIAMPAARPTAAVLWLDPLIDQEKNQATLRWENKSPGVVGYQLFRATNDEPLQRYRMLEGTLKEWVDKPLEKGSRYTYQILALFEGGKTSALSLTKIIEF